MIYQKPVWMVFHPTNSLVIQLSECLITAVSSYKMSVQDMYASTMSYTTHMQLVTNAKFRRYGVYYKTVLWKSTSLIF